LDLILEAFCDAVELILSANPELISIARLSLAVSLSSTLIAAALGVPLGVALHAGRFGGLGLLMLVYADMALPPVVVGLHCHAAYLADGAARPAAPAIHPAGDGHRPRDRGAAADRRLHACGD
jgi:tungstate transport system permease protein